MQQKTLTHFSAESCCDETQMPSDCCHDEIKTSTDQSSSAPVFEASMAAGWVLLFVLPSFFALLYRSLRCLSIIRTTDQGPPLSANLPLYLWVASWRL